MRILEAVSVPPYDGEGTLPAQLTYVFLVDPEINNACIRAEYYLSGKA